MKEENRSNVINFETQGHGASMGRVDEGEAAISDDSSEHQIDDRGTDQSEAASVLKRVRDELFEASDEKLALALGRTSDEIGEWLNGEATIDGDAFMKVRALERERN